VGRDSLGRLFVELLERERVGAEGLLYSDALSTAVGLIVCGPGGSSIIVIDVGANGAFQPTDVAAQAHLIENSDVVLSPLEIPIETALAAAAMAANRGIPAILNPAPAVDLRREDLRAVFALTPNETEARICLGLPPGDAAPVEDLARALLDLGPQNVIVTLGAEGAVWACGRRLRRIPALEVAVLDTVGAGDAFNAGLAVGLSEHREIEEAIALGIAAASLSTRKRETIDSYPYRKEVDTWAPEVRARIATC
jgi:ribokinase